MKIIMKNAGFLNKETKFLFQFQPQMVINLDEDLDIDKKKTRFVESDQPSNDTSSASKKKLQIKDQPLKEGESDFINDISSDEISY